MTTAGSFDLDRLEAAVDLALDRRARRRRCRPSTRSVACGQSSSAASIWPVWLASSSIACLPRMTSCGCSLSTIACSSLATASGCSSTSVSTRIARSAPSASAVRSVSWQAGDAARDRDDLGGDALLLQAHRLLDGDLVEGIHRHLHVGGVDAAAVGLDADLDVEVDDALDGDEDFHGRLTGRREIEGNYTVPDGPLPSRRRSLAFAILRPRFASAAIVAGHASAVPHRPPSPSPAPWSLPPPRRTCFRPSTAPRCRWRGELPFAGLLLSIAFAPLLAPKFWHDHYGKFAALWVLRAPGPVHRDVRRGEAMHNVAHAIVLEYVPFLAMLFALFTIAGGICLRGTLAGTPARQHRAPRAGRLPREHHGHDRRVDAADPAAAHRQRGAAPPRARRRLLHPPRRQRGRRAVAARRSAAVHRLPQGRRFLLDHARAGVADAVSRASRCSRCSTRSITCSTAASAPARRAPPDAIAAVDRGRAEFPAAGAASSASC